MTDKIEYEIQVSDKFSSPLASLEKHLKDIAKGFKSLTDSVNKYNKEEDKFAKKSLKERAQAAKERFEERQRVVVAKHESYIKRNRSQINHLESKQLQSQAKDLELQQSKFSITNAKIKENLEKSRLNLDKVNAVQSKRALEMEKTKHNLIKAERERFNAMEKMRKISAVRGLSTPVRFQNGRFVNDSKIAGGNISNLSGSRQSALPSARQSPAMLGGLSSFGGMARAMGAYEIIDRAMQVPRDVYSNLKANRGIEASLEAFKQIGIAPELGSSKKEMQDIMGIADKYGVRFDTIVDPYRKILATKSLSPEKTKQLMSGMAAFANVTGMDNNAQKSAFLAFEQMLTQKKILGQEFNLQLQQAPGLKDLFFQAFKKATEVQGIPGVKGTITKENMAEKFVEYREKGLMTSDIILKHLADILMDENLQRMGIKKGHTVQGEENRMANAYFRATSAAGNVIEGPITSGLIRMANLFNSLSEKMNTFGQSLSTISNWLQNTSSDPTVMKGIIKGALVGDRSIAGSLLSLPQNLGRIGYDIGMTPILAGGAAFTGDWTDYNKYRDERNAYWFNGAEFSDSSTVKLLKNINDAEDYKFKYSRIPSNYQSNPEQVIKVILEGKNMPPNMTANVQNYGASTTNLRVEKNISGGY